jgi:signal transduction histidine kinase
VELLAPQAARAKVLLRADVPEAGPVLAFDRDRLGQVFRNLLGNALKFTPAGGHVTLRIRPAGASVRCEVQDTGPGIAPEEQARLFVPFTQLAAGRRHDGVGLGLAICKAIVEAHGGQIGLTSAPGRGSTFWFGLPAGCPPPEAHQAGHVVPTDVPGAPPAV